MLEEKHGINGIQDRMSNSNYDAFLTTTLHEAFIFNPEIRMLLDRLDGSMKRFHEFWFQVNSGMCDSDGLHLSAVWLLPGTRHIKIQSLAGKCELWHVVIEHTPQIIEISRFIRENEKTQDLISLRK